MRRNIILVLVVLVPLLIWCSGCTEAQIARSEAGVVRAQQAVTSASAAVASASTAVAAARELGDQVLYARASDALTRATEAARAADYALSAATSTVAAARAAHDAGGSTTDVLLAGAGGLVPGLLALLPALAQLARYRTALRQAAAHADRMEAAETDADVKAGKKISAAEQNAAGVRTLIDNARAA